MNPFFKNLLPSNLSVLLKRLGWVFLCMQLCRVVFYFSNQADFSLVAANDWVVGAGFDVLTICLFFLPFITLSILPGNFTTRAWYQGVLRGLFLVLNSTLVFFNLIDVEYFRFTKKRSTVDVFEMVQGGNDLSQQLTSYFRDFWFVMLLFVVFLWISNRVFTKTVNKYDQLPTKLYKQFITLVLALGVTVFIGRGGFVLKPLSPIDASQFTRIENTAFVLNTPFTMAKSWSKVGLQEKNYFSLKEEKKLFNPIRTSVPQHILPNKTNVVVLIVESFGNEWVGAAGAKKSFTPFLDSLTKESLYFKNGIANGKKSIEAVPSIFASIPSLLEIPYISSQYGNNHIEGLPRILKKEGYTSAFFHGATNGSMKFDGFAAQAGFDHYFGRKEYNNEIHYDGSWGILDEYFNPWTARKLSTLKQPFLASLFTLSSHHPFYIPPHMRGKLRKGPQPICEATHYGDYSLRKFFETAKKQPWYKNTVFVLCADHTAATINPKYNQRTEMYKIPIVFFDPSGRLKKEKNEELFQQIDILPTLLDVLNIKTNYYSFGNSYFQKHDKEAVAYLDGSYYYFQNNFLLSFSQEKARYLYSLDSRANKVVDSMKKHPKESKKMERRLKAMVQRYNRDLIHNQTTVYEKENIFHH
jgi:phosphoglycerol transferase MdoB-like AlkP superfamily enzyme